MNGMDENKKSIASEIADGIEQDIESSKGLDVIWKNISNQYKRRLKVGWKNRIQKALDEVRNLF